MEESERIHVHDLAISVRTTNLIRRELNIKYLDELCLKTPGEILSHKNIGLRSLNEIRTILKENDMCLKGDVILTCEKKIEMNKYIPQILIQIKDTLEGMEKKIRGLSIQINLLSEEMNCKK